MERNNRSGVGIVFLGCRELMGEEVNKRGSKEGRDG
jgi:hypothetical protein